MTGIKLTINKLDKFYGAVHQGVHAVRDLSMSVQNGEIVALLGSSGCGKTSTLRMIAGFEEVSRGTIELAGKVINRLTPDKRDVAMAFEGYSLYPPLTVRDNIAFALKSSKLSTSDQQSRVSEIAAMLEIEDILDRYPSSISGGQQQRASLGRALIRDAELHLLDEPMGQLEPQLRALLRGRIKHFIKSRGLTAILVTHDQTEANALADRIAVMEEGTLQQFDTPERIKEQPANLFSGTFMGEPPMNVFDAQIKFDNSMLAIHLPGKVVIQYASQSFAEPVLQALCQPRDLVVGIRPFAVKRGSQGVAATVVANQWLGDQSHIAAEFAGKLLVMVEHDRASDRPGDVIHLHFDPASLHVFDRESGHAIAHGRELAP